MTVSWEYFVFDTGLGLALYALAGSGRRGSKLGFRVLAPAWAAGDDRVAAWCGWGDRLLDDPAALPEHAPDDTDRPDESFGRSSLPDERTRRGSLADAPGVRDSLRQRASAAAARHSAPGALA